MSWPERSSQRKHRRLSHGPYDGRLSAGTTGLTEYVGVRLSFEGGTQCQPAGQAPVGAECSAQSAAETSEAGPRFRSKLRRVSFGCAFRTVVDWDACTECGPATSEALRPSDRGRYYPEASTSAAQKRRRELQKRPVGDRQPGAHWWDAFDAMCGCKKGCGSGCPCAVNGIGCWWERGDSPEYDWGCGCRGQCTAPAAYVCDLPTLKEARAARLAQLASQTTLAENAYSQATSC